MDNLINYFKNYNHKYIDLIKYNLAFKIYYYGDQFNKKKFKLINIIKNILIYIITSVKNRSSKSKLVLSAAYFNYDNYIKDKGYSVERIHCYQRINNRTGCNFNIFIKSNYIQYCFDNKDFKYLTSTKIENLINSLKIDIYNYIKEKNYTALFVPNDLDLFMKIYIDVFKSLNKPTFLLSHGGMPSVYDLEIDNRTDYLVVWGNAQKNAYIKNGYNKDKIFVSGHPNYKYIKDLKINSSKDNILIISKSLSGVPQYYELEDRGKSIVYLMAIKDVLKKIGVSKVRLRLHPSENYKFYNKFIDDDFFVPDFEDLNNSLNKSTMVIGPRSTVIVDAIYMGVNYFIFEPKIENKDIYGHRITPPLDGSLKGLNISRNESELFTQLSENRLVDKNVINELCDKGFDDKFINLLNEL